MDRHFITKKAFVGDLISYLAKLINRDLLPCFFCVISTLFRLFIFNCIIQTLTEFF